MILRFTTVVQTLFFVKTSFGKDLWNYLKDNSIVIRFMGDYIRISVGTEEENEELISCIKTYLSR